MDPGDQSIGMDEFMNCPDMIFAAGNEDADFIFANGYPSLDQALLIDNYTPSGLIPAREDFPGHFNFIFKLDQSTSSQNWVYSNPLKQLFIGMNKTLIINFQMSPMMWSKNMNYYIRALPVYSTDDYVNVPVNRCTFHSCEDDPHSRAHQIPGQCLCEENNFVGHVVRAECEAEYLYDPRSERHSVRVLISNPQAGSDCIPIAYSFACKTSCPKGMQRRPIHVIFTLEDDIGNVYGRQKLGVKICSCPKRDKKRQEDDYWTEQGGEKKRKRLVTAEDVRNALHFTKQVKIENEESTPKEDLKRQILVDLEGVKRGVNEIKKYCADISTRIKRIEENQEKL